VTAERRRWWVGVGLKCAAVGGLIGFLLLSQGLPAYAVQFRWAALIWFFGLGAVKCAIDLGHRRRR
jgi:hypothetical protein